MSSTCGAMDRVAAALTLVIYLMIKARILYAKKIDSDEARVGGCGEEFLASLPPYRG